MYYPFRSEQLATSLEKQMATDLILMACEMHPGEVKASILYLYIFHISLSQATRAFCRSTDESKEVSFPHMI